jgi:uncharacterized membrane protein (UPF0136 family)
VHSTLISLPVIGFLVGAGGVMGFVKAKSKASLISGLVSAVLYFIAFAVSQQDAKAGAIMGSAVSIALCIVFAIRLKKTGKFMPAGLLLILCGLEAVVTSLTVFQLSQS